MTQYNPSQTNRLIVGRPMRPMSQEEFRAYIMQTRKASTMRAMSALSATLTLSTNESETK